MIKWIFLLADARPIDKWKHVQCIQQEDDWETASVDEAHICKMMLQPLFQMQIIMTMWCFPTSVANQNTYHHNTWTLVLCNKNQRVWIDRCCNPGLPGVWSFQKGWQGQGVRQEQSGQRGLFQLLHSGSWRLALGVNRQGCGSTASVPDLSRKRLPSVTAWFHTILCATNGIHVITSWPSSGSPSGPVLVPSSLQD